MCYVIVEFRVLGGFVDEAFILSASVLVFGLNVSQSEILHLIIYPCYFFSRDG